MTKELLQLMGTDLHKIEAPSQIYHNGKFIGFPLSPLDLMLKLGPITILKAGLELIFARMRSSDGDGSFESFAARMYGETLARLFLLNYSEKLWGLPGTALSPHISGKRLKGLDLGTFLKETLRKRQGDSNHLEGSFYYPKGGYGAIVDKLAQVCGSTNIRTNSRITKISHRQGRINHLWINDQARIDVDEVVSTLPLPLFLRILEPEPERQILEAAQTLRFRNLILATLFLDRERISNNASIYISDPGIPITRIYEPKNRSEIMAPPGKTSLCVEIPCNPGDPMWCKDDDELISLARSELMKLEIIQEEDISGGVVHRMHHAYPVLNLETEKTVAMLYEYVGKFQNLRISGRNGKFLYTHLHDMLRFGWEVIDDLISSAGDQ
jgi:protoporphyrinogen oxidase